MAGYTIREYAPADREQVVNMVVNGLLEFAKTPEQKASTRKYTDDTVNRDLNTLEKQMREGSLPFNRRFWVAVEGDKIIACISLKPTMMQPRESKKSANIHSLSVAPSHRRQGVAAKLLETLEKHCAQQGIQTIKLTTQENLKPAVRFYQNHGYTVDKKERWGALNLLKLSKPTPELQADHDAANEPAANPRKRRHRTG